MRAKDLTSDTGSAGRCRWDTFSIRNSFNVLSIEHEFSAIAQSAARQPNKKVSQGSNRYYKTTRVFMGILGARLYSSPCSEGLADFIDAIPLRRSLPL